MNKMKVGQLENIIKLVSLEGLIKDFCIDTDGSVKAIDEVNTLLVDLQYNGIELENKIGIDNGKKTMHLLSSFDKDQELVFTDSHITVTDKKGKKAKIPLVNTENIKPSPVLPIREPDMFIYGVPLENLKAAASHKILELDEEYVFYVEDKITMLQVGNESCGLVTEPLGEISGIINQVQVALSMNLIQTIRSLEQNPDINFYVDGFVRFEVKTDQYSVKYTLAGLLNK